MTGEPPTSDLVAGSATESPGALLRRYSAFVYEEAELLDSMDFDRWLDLFDEDSIYWLPVDPAATSPLDTLNLVYDDRARLADRVSRFRSGFSFSETPASRTSHLLANLRLVGAEEAARTTTERPLQLGEVVLAGRGTIARLRRSAVDTFHARLSWVLRPAPGSFTIVMKRIDLLQSQEPLPLLTFLL